MSMSWSLLTQSSLYAFGLYTALNALIMLVLSMLVVRARVATQTEIGDGGKPAMAAPLRAHANNAEYVPMALLLMWGLATPLGATIWLIHGIGIPLTLGRILHAIGLSRSTGVSTFRFLGMVLTWIAYIVGIVGLFYGVFFVQPTAS
ncbi:MAG TPA: MAPEG family protein [Rhizomicrobium sp.]|nr:MAPEG family protein [Rhizomicrobium sp.]